MKILYLTLKRQWFQMILSGAKKEEYREIKPYWNRRLHTETFGIIEFRNGYSKDCPRFQIECLSVQRGLGIVEWGAPEKEVVYILRLGKVLNVEIKPPQHLTSGSTALKRPCVPQAVVQHEPR